jgi:uncharacterized DUF497 family protein
VRGGRLPAANGRGRRHVTREATVARPGFRIYTYWVRITDDSAKRDKTPAERGLDFEDAAVVFEGITVEVVDERKSCGERRIVCYGLLQGRMVVVGYTPRDRARHVFSMRKANSREQARLASFFGL